jgi:MFS family permease
MFTWPVFTIFLFSNGLNMTEVMLLESIFSIMLITLQVPTGALADLIGRKGCMTAGLSLIAIGSVLYSIGTNFWQFAFAEIIWGIGSAIMSGANVALLYDTLKQNKKAKLSTRIFGNIYFYVLFAGVVASLASGLIIAAYSIRWTWYFTTVAIAIAAVLSLFLIEPKQKKAKFNIKNYYWKMLDSIKLIAKNKRLGLLTFNAALTGCIGTIGFWFYQPHMRASGIPIELFGIVFAGFSIFAAFSAKFAHHVERRLDLRKIVWLSPFLSAIALIGLATFFSPIISIPMIFILQFVRGFSGPTLTTLSNQVMPSEMRATINSVGGMISRTFFVALGPLFGFFSDNISLSFALLMVALVAAIQIPLFGIKPEKVRK